MKKRMIWVSALVAVMAIIGGSIYAYQQKEDREQTAEQQKKEALAAQQASTQAEKELEAAQRAKIITMPKEPTAPADNIERGWTNENATKFVANVGQANKNREMFPKLAVVESNDLAAQPQFKKYFVAPYWALVLEPNEKPRQVFLKNNGNHTVTMILTQGITMVPVHQYVVDSSTFQVINEKAIDVATSITAWTEF